MDLDILEINVKHYNN